MHVKCHSVPNHWSKKKNSICAATLHQLIKLRPSGLFMIAKNSACSKEATTHEGNIGMSKGFLDVMVVCFD